MPAVLEGTRGAHHKVCGKLLSARRKRHRIDAFKVLKRLGEPRRGQFRIIHDLRLPVVAAEIGQHGAIPVRRLDRLFVADQIIVHDKNDAEPRVAEPFELGQEGHKQSEARDRKVRALSQQADAVLRAPKGNFQAGLMMTISAMVVCRDERTNSLAGKYGRFGPLGLPRFDPPL